MTDGRNPSRRVLLALPAVAGLLQSASAQSAMDIGRRTMEATRNAYRALHENPELGMQEYFASSYVRRELSGLPGISFVDLSSLPTAVIAVLRGGLPGPAIALRAELDARRLDLGVVEPLSHDPRSHTDGLMHNCGHDAHAAMLLGAAIELSHQRQSLRGTIVFLFQPAEETAGGADDVVDDGVLERLRVKAVFAQHCVPGLNAGSIQLSRGAFLASSTSFELLLQGQASHAAAPFDGSDLPLLAAQAISELALFPARKLDIINRPVVISTTQMSTNAESLNGLPSQVRLRGTIRAFEDIEASRSGEPSIASALQSRMSQLASVHGASAAMSVKRGSPPTVNDHTLGALALTSLQRRFGNALAPSSYRGMFSEDFAFISERFPSLYFSLGIQRDDLGAVGVHQPHFTIHPAALQTGTRLMVALGQEIPRALGQA